MLVINVSVSNLIGLVIRSYAALTVSISLTHAYI